MSKATKTAAPKPVDEDIDFSTEAMMGMENVRTEDLGIPFLQIIQHMSPERDRTSPKFITGSDAGMIFNSVTRDVIGGEGEALTFVPCSYKKMYVEWRPRDQSGGYVASHVDPNIMSRTKRDEAGHDVLENGNLIVPTAYIFGLAIVGEENVQPCVISFSSTQLKKARGWLSQMMSIKLEGKAGKFTPPMFAFKYLLSSVLEQNAKGKWYGWKIERGEILKPADKSLLDTARGMVTSSARLLPVAVDAPEGEAEAY